MRRQVVNRPILLATAWVIVAGVAAASPAAAAPNTQRLSVSSGDVQGDSGSFYAAASGKGTLTAFGSTASNLVANDGNGAGDVFIRDRKKKKTKRVSTRSNGGEANGFSSNPSI